MEAAPRERHESTVDDLSNYVKPGILDSSDDDGEYVAAKDRRTQEINKIKRKLEVADSDSEGEDSDTVVVQPKQQMSMRKKTLLAQSHQLRREAEKNKKDDAEAEFEAVREEENRILDQVSRSMNQPLMSVQERAKGIVYRERTRTSWVLPRKYREMDENTVQEFRDKFYIDTSGPDVPPPIPSFKDMRFPPPILKTLEKKGIIHPTQIQMQGIPSVLLGRDLIGIAFTGSGKTVCFVLPAVMFAVEAEMRSPLKGGEGPLALVLVPSRELATQIFETVQLYSHALRDGNYAELRNLLMMGGITTQEQCIHVRRGAHVMVATPGRLNDMLNKKRMHLHQCTYLAMDEADRLIDLGFEDEIRNVFDHFSHQRQTLLFSATMPRKIQEFAKATLVDPIVVNVGRAGAANLDVVQEVEYVKQENKLPYILHCLQKTAPPVVIFCENKKDVDDAHEYLLLKGVDAVAIHGSLAQEERNMAVRAFREGRKDVLIGTDVASKGLDFPAIQHVINFDMPREIENYVHRIGRTGRCGRTGVATTFINKNQEETVLLDLKAILIEARQKIPPFLEALDQNRNNLKDIGGIRGCAYCGGLGHRIAQCPKLETQNKKQQQTTDSLTTSRYGGTTGYGGEW